MDWNDEYMTMTITIPIHSVWNKEELPDHTYVVVSV
jgi:hypothetical protein